MSRTMSFNPLSSRRCASQGAANAHRVQGWVSIRFDPEGVPHVGSLTQSAERKSFNLLDREGVPHRR